MRWILIANPGTPRCEGFREAFHVYWTGRATLEVVPWADVIRGDGNLDGMEAFDRPAIVRLESPGKSNVVTRELLAAGSRDKPDENATNWASLDLPKGLLVRPGLQHRGFCRTLRGLRQAFNARPHLELTACPLAIVEMFDKTTTCQRLHDADIPVPPWLENPADVFAYLLDSNRRESYYLKLNTGSASVGICRIVRDVQQDRLVGRTTVVAHDSRFWNSRKLHDYTGEVLGRVAKFILDEGAIAQKGIPLAQLDGQNFDVRVVCRHGRPIAIVVRRSPHPMTNLHLGGTRGDLERCRSLIPKRLWLDALDHSAEAASCFDSAIAGVDLVFDRGLRDYAILEVNAFGDFFPGWTNEAGRTIPQLEFDAFQSRQ